MPWTNPIIYSVAQRLFAADMNLISDNLRETSPAKAQTIGGLFYSDGVNSIAELDPPAGAGLYILRGGRQAAVWQEVLTARPASLTASGDDAKPLNDAAAEATLVRKNRVMYWRSDRGSRTHTIPRPYLYRRRSCTISGPYNASAGTSGRGAVAYGTGDDVLTVNITAAGGFFAAIKAR